MSRQLEELWEERYAASYRATLTVDDVRRRGQRRRIVQRVGIPALVATLAFAWAGGLYVYATTTQHPSGVSVAGSPDPHMSTPGVPDDSASPAPSSETPSEDTSSASPHPTPHPGGLPVSTSAPTSTPSLSEAFPALTALGWPVASMETVRFAPASDDGCQALNGLLGPGSLTFQLADGTRQVRLTRLTASPTEALQRVRACQTAAGEKISAAVSTPSGPQETTQRWTSTTSASRWSRYRDQPVVTSNLLHTLNRQAVWIQVIAPGSDVALLKADEQGPLKALHANVEKVLAGTMSPTSPSRGAVDASTYVQPDGKKRPGGQWTSWEYRPTSIMGGPSIPTLTVEVDGHAVNLSVRVEKLASTSEAAARVASTAKDNGALYPAKASWEVAGAGEVHVGNDGNSTEWALTSTGPYVVWVNSPLAAKGLLQAALQMQISRLN